MVIEEPETLQVPVVQVLTTLGLPLAGRPITVFAAVNDSDTFIYDDSVRFIQSEAVTNASGHAELVGLVPTSGVTGIYHLVVLRILTKVHV